MNNGFGEIPLFKIPKSSALVGIQLFGQGAISIPTLGQEHWSPGVAMVIQ